MAFKKWKRTEKSKKDKFKLFQRLKEKRSNSLKTDSLEDIFTSSRYDFTYVPSDAYKDMIDEGVGDHLKHGMYVCQERTKFDELVLSYSLDMIDEHEYELDSLLDFISWYESKQILNNLGAKMLNNSEAISTIEWLYKNDYQDPLYSSIAGSKGEFLENIFRLVIQPVFIPEEHECTMTTNTEVDDKVIKNGNRKEIPYFLKGEGFFDFDAFDKQAGYPEKIGKFGFYFFKEINRYDVETSYTYSSKVGILFSRHLDSNGGGRPGIYNGFDPTKSDKGIGFRMAYPADKSGNMIYSGGSK